MISTNMNLIVQEICKNLALCGIASLKLALISEKSFGALIYVIFIILSRYNKYNFFSLRWRAN